MAGCGHRVQRDGAGLFADNVGGCSGTQLADTWIPERLRVRLLEGSRRCPQDAVGGEGLRGVQVHYIYIHIQMAVRLA